MRFCIAFFCVMATITIWKLVEYTPPWYSFTPIFMGAGVFLALLEDVRNVLKI